MTVSYITSGRIIRRAIASGRNPAAFMYNSDNE